MGPCPIPVHTIHQPTEYVFQLVTLTVLEKSVMKIYLITGWKEGMMDGRNDGWTWLIQYSQTFFKAYISVNFRYFFFFLEFLHLFFAYK